MSYVLLVAEAKATNALVSARLPVGSDSQARVAAQAWSAAHPAATWRYDAWHVTEGASARLRRTGQAAA